MEVKKSSAEELDEAYDIIEPIFEKVTTFEELIDAYILHLEGKIPVTPTYGGALFPDTIAQVDNIIKLNKLGFLTLDSQDGLRTENKLQRAYIDGYMYNNTFQKIVSKLIRTEIIYMSFYLIIEIEEDHPRFPVTIKIPENTMETSISLIGYGNCSDWDNILDMSPELEDNVDIKELRFVQFIDPIWCRSNLLVDLLLACMEDK